jgi:hypothetical protein
MPWTYADLSGPPGGPAAATGPFAYVFEAAGTQHVDYAGVDGHVHELWWDSSGWHHIDLTATTGAPELSGSRTNAPTAYVFAAYGTQHIVFVADQGPTTGHVHEIWRGDTGWNHFDLTRATGAPLALPGQPCGYAFEAQKTQHVDYVGMDGNLHELWWDSHGWHHHRLTPPGSPLAPRPRWAPVGYAMSRGTQHVHYISGSGRIHELMWSGGTWYHHGLTAWTGGPPANSLSFAEYGLSAKGTQFVSYVGVDGDVHELWADTSGWWRHVNASAASGIAGPGAGGGVVCAYSFPYDGTRHVAYTSAEGHVHELWSDGPRWHHNDLSLAAGAPLADFAPLAAYATPHTQHVDFIQIDGFHVYELRWHRRRVGLGELPR